MNCSHGDEVFAGCMARRAEDPCPQDAGGILLKQQGPGASAARLPLYFEEAKP